MIEIVKYTPSHKHIWDSFVGEADMQSLMFYRDYMEYHQHRYNELSLMLFDNDKLKALLPGNYNNNNFYSHQLLSFGGLIHLQNTQLSKLTEYLEVFLDNLKMLGMKQVTIKLSPFFYSSSLSMSQDYLLKGRLNATCNIKPGAFINCIKHKFPKSSIEKRKLSLDSFNLFENAGFNAFWDVLKMNLSVSCNSEPAHSLKDIEYLHSKFPDNIRLAQVVNNKSGELDAGCVIFDYNNIIWTPYIATSEAGRENRATHALYYYLINTYTKTHQYIDLGAFTMNNKLNQGLLNLKERFGASIYYSNIYTIKID